VLCHALRLSGRMIDALDANTEALDRVGEIGKFDRQMLGFDVEPWLIAMRGQTLVMLSRGEEARDYLDRVIAMDATRVDVIHRVIPSLAYVDLAWALGDVQLAERHAERAYVMAVRSGIPYLRVYAQASRGLSHIAAGRPDEAVRDLVEALGFARRRKAGLENEARILADLANVYRLNGERGSAVSAAEEAIEIATVRHARVPECLARVVNAECLLASESSAALAKATREVAQAEELMRKTGAEIYAPLVQATKAKFNFPSRAAAGEVAS